MTGFARPANGPETQPFATIQLQDGLPHAGTDFGLTDAAGKARPEVYAAESGTVLFAGDSRTLGWPNPWYTNPDFDRTDAWDSSAGNMVVIGHRDGVTTYNHLAAYTVRKGDTVTRGQRIATIGATGNANGPHLHFEWIPYPFNFGTATYGRARPSFSTVTTQGAPARTGLFMYLTKEQEIEVLNAARLINARAKYLDAPVSQVPAKSAKELLDSKLTRKGPGRSGVTTPRGAFEYLDSNLDAANDDAGRAGVPAPAPVAEAGK